MPTKRELREIWEEKKRIADELGRGAHGVEGPGSQGDPSSSFSEEEFMAARREADAAQSAYLSAPFDGTDETSDAR